MAAVQRAAPQKRKQADLEDSASVAVKVQVPTAEELVAAATPNTTAPATATTTEQAGTTAATDPPATPPSAPLVCLPVKTIDRTLFTCEVCFKVWRKPSLLKQHMVTHSQERPFVCTVFGCGKRYSRIDHLNR